VVNDEGVNALASGMEGAATGIVLKDSPDDIPKLDS